jgi:S-adenosyl-L-methionine hydrolase (adenosine-forming)
MSGGSVITLLTDFGTTDGYVAEVKGTLLSRAPGAVLVDVTHDVPPGDIRAAQVVLGRVWHRFPPGTVHFCVVDPGVGGPRAALALAVGGHRFVGPDNGVFTEVLHGARVVALPIPPDASATFHGRDVFAPAAAALAAGAPLSDLGAPVAPRERLPLPRPRTEGSLTVGEVLVADRFGNLITNLPAASGSVEVGGRAVGPVRRTFADVAPGAVVAYVGSGGTIEVAVRDGSAALRFGAGRGTVVRVTGSGDAGRALPA